MSTSFGPPVSATIKTATPQSDYRGLVIAGWVFVFLMPIIGFFLGLVVTNKGRTVHGIGQMIVAVVFGFWLVNSAINDSITTTTQALDTYSNCLDHAHTMAQLNRC